MVEIKEVIKSPKAVMCLICLVILALLFVLALQNGAEKSSFLPEPAHIVLNKWTDKYDRRRSMSFILIEENATYRTSLKNIPSSQTKLILKTENLRFMLYAKGKIIFDNTNERLSGYGDEIHIIDISDMRENAELFLYLSPIKSASSAIDSDIILTSKNDFLLDLLSKNIKKILLCLLLFLCFVFFLLFGTINLTKKKKSAPKILYFSCCIGLVFLIFFLKCEAFLPITCGTFSYILLFLSPSLLGVFVSAFLCSLLKLKSKIINCFIGLIMLYCAVRTALFFFLLIPLTNALFISHCLLISSVVFPLIIKLCRLISRAFFILYSILFSYRS